MSHKFPKYVIKMAKVKIGSNHVYIIIFIVLNITMFRKKNWNPTSEYFTSVTFETAKNGMDVINI